MLVTRNIEKKLVYKSTYLHERETKISVLDFATTALVIESNAPILMVETLTYV